MKGVFLSGRYLFTGFYSTCVCTCTPTMEMKAFTVSVYVPNVSTDACIPAGARPKDFFFLIQQHKNH